MRGMTGWDSHRFRRSHVLAIAALLAIGLALFMRSRPEHESPERSGLAAPPTVHAARSLQQNLPPQAVAAPASETQPGLLDEAARWLGFGLEARINRLLSANEVKAYAFVAEALTMGCGLGEPKHPDCARNPQWLRERDDWVDAALCARHPGAAGLLAMSAPDSWHVVHSRADPAILAQRRQEAAALSEMEARDGNLLTLIGIAARDSVHKPRNDAATARFVGLAGRVIEGLRHPPAAMGEHHADFKQALPQWIGMRNKALAALDEPNRALAAELQAEWAQPLPAQRQRELLERPCRNPLSIRLGLKP